MYRFDFEDVKRSVNIREAAQLLGIQVDNWGKALCPFHSDKRKGNFSITTKNGVGIYKCFSCGAGGNVINLVMNTLSCDAMDAVRWLNDNFHLGIEFGELNGENKKELRRKAKKRAEDARIIAQFQADIRNAEDKLCYWTRLFNTVQNNKVFHFWDSPLWEIALEFDTLLHYYLDLLQDSHIDTATKVDVINDANKIYERLEMRVFGNYARNSRHATAERLQTSPVSC